MNVNIYLNFAGKTEEAFRFYEKALGGEDLQIVRFKDMPMPGMELPKAEQDKVMHASLRIAGDTMLMGTDMLESMGQKLVVGNHCSISLHPDSKEQADRVFRALAEGGNVETPMADAPWGDYWGNLTDRFGVQWMVNFAYATEAEKKAATERSMQAMQKSA